MSADWYAGRKGWQLLKANLMVEGNLDVKYFSIANEHYQKTNKKCLIGKDLSIFAAGTGDNGGTFGILDEFPTLFKLINVDLDPNGRRKYCLGVLFDFDPNGQKAAAALPRVNRSIQMWREIFLLHRKLPYRTRDFGPLAKHIGEENKKYSNLHCEIEDLLDLGLINCFISENPRAERRKQEIEDGFHVNWNEDEKHKLVRFAQEYGSPDDFTRVVETLKSLRFYLGLPRDGIDL